MIIGTLNEKRGDKLGCKKIEYVGKRVIVSGNIVEVFIYQRPYVRGYGLNEAEKASRAHKFDFDGGPDGDSRERALNRARTNLRRLVNANYGQYGSEFTAKFVTLTFGPNITDLKMANYEYTKFVKRLNYRMFDTKKANLRYTAVVHFQKRGAVHYHVIFYNLPYLKAKELESLWGNGFVKINKIDHVDNVGAYVCKYMTKEADDERLRGNKCYFSSRSLFRPNEITDKEMVETVAAALPVESLVYSSTFENEYLGLITYEQYNLNAIIA